jgi:hypothetical protein
MATYRFFFLDGSDQVREAEAHDFAHDNDAVVNGPARCAQHSGYAMEIWQGTRRVHRRKMIDSNPSCQSLFRSS